MILAFTLKLISHLIFTLKLNLTLTYNFLTLNLNNDYDYAHGVMTMTMTMTIPKHADSGEVGLDPLDLILLPTRLSGNASYFFN